MLERLCLILLCAVVVATICSYCMERLAEIAARAWMDKNLKCVMASPPASVPAVSPVALVLPLPHLRDDSSEGWEVIDLSPAPLADDEHIRAPHRNLKRGSRTKTQSLDEAWRVVVDTFDHPCKICNSQSWDACCKYSRLVQCHVEQQPDQPCRKGHRSIGCEGLGSHWVETVQCAMLWTYLRPKVSTHVVLLSNVAMQETNQSAVQSPAMQEKDWNDLAVSKWHNLPLQWSEVHKTVVMYLYTHLVESFAKIV